MARTFPIVPKSVTMGTLVFQTKVGLDGVVLDAQKYRVQGRNVNFALGRIESRKREPDSVAYGFVVSEDDSLLAAIEVESTRNSAAVIQGNREAAQLAFVELRQKEAGWFVIQDGRGDSR